MKVVKVHSITQQGKAWGAQPGSHRSAHLNDLSPSPMNDNTGSLVFHLTSVPVVEALVVAGTDHVIGDAGSNYCHGSTQFVTGHVQGHVVQLIGRSTA